MNGEAEYSESGKYNPGRPENLLATFVEVWFNPKGRAGNGSWHYGRMATVMSYLLSASQCPHEIVGGFVSFERNSVAEKFEHIWIEVQKDKFAEGEKAFEVFDPARRKFGWPEYKDQNYEAVTRWPSVKFMPLVFQTGEQKDPAIEEVASVIKHDDQTMTLSVSVADGFPCFDLRISDIEAMNLADRIYRNLQIPKPTREINIPADHFADVKSTTDKLLLEILGEIRKGALKDAA